MPIQPASVRTLYSGHSNEFLHNIRIAFERARYDGAILLLDDMDWLASASAGEFAPDMLRALSQMQVYLDDFPGIVICTACRAEGLAHGFLRRFAARLKTNFLTPVQTSLMIRALTQPTKGSGEIGRAHV